MRTQTPHSNSSTKLLAVVVATVAVALVASTVPTISTGAPTLKRTSDALSARKALDVPTSVHAITIDYRSHTGSVRHAVVLVPASYPRKGGRPLPLVISPHGRNLDGAKNAKLWGNLPALGFFAVVNPDGQGDRLDSLSWGATGQIADLARMPRIVQARLPWLRIDCHRIYAVGGSMGGQETLLLAGRYPSLLAGAIAIDPVTDFGHQYYQYPRLRCLGACKRFYGDLGAALQAKARIETGGTPTTAPAAYSLRSPEHYAKVLAGLRIPIQIWWSSRDRIVVDSDSAQSGLLLGTLHRIDPKTTVVGVRGTWRHTAPLKASRQLPSALAAIGLMSCRYADGNGQLHVVVGARPTCWTNEDLRV